MYRPPGFEVLTWLPYNAFCRIRDSDENLIWVDLSRYSVNKKFQMSLPPMDSGLSTQLKVFGFREPLNCRCYVEFIDSNDTLLDIGSNIGFFTLLGSSARRVICVEPLDNAIKFLKRNVSLNNLSDKCEVVRAAVGPRGKLNVEVHDHLNLSRVVMERSERTVEVDSIPLRDLTERYPVNMLRLDVEGFEYDILCGQVPDSIDKISMEFHTVRMGRERSIELLEYFEQEGFRLRYLIEDVPLRLYPFYRLLKGGSVFRLASYVKQNLEVRDALEYVFKGRALKYLYLQR